MERGLLDVRLHIQNLQLEVDKLKYEVAMLRDRTWWLEDQQRYWIGSLLWLWNTNTFKTIAFTSQKKKLPPAREDQTDVEAGGEDANREGEGQSMES